MEGGIELGSIAILENVIFTDITKRNVIAEDPTVVIDLLNKTSESDRKLSRNNEYHFDIAQELLTLYLNMN